MQYLIRLFFIASTFWAILAVRGDGQLVAFPGAEGEGRLTSGGRGGDVYHVTNLSDSGSGSLRHGIDSMVGPRSIVFDVSGAIALQSTLRVRRPDVTIAGETAPGQGIALINYGLKVQQPNVIIRHIRVRPGDAHKGPNSEGGFSGDAISIASSDVILDHVSAAWGIDENLSVAGNGNTGVTVQHSIISEGLDQTGLWHDEWNSDYDPGGSGHHSHGSLIKPITGIGVITYHHNLWSNNWNRNPAVGTYTTEQSLAVDLRNNVLYNNRNGGYSSGASSRVDMNYVGNYIISGPDTAGSFSPFQANSDNNLSIYQADNKLDENKNGVIDGMNNPLDIITGDYTSLNSPVPMASVTTDPVDDNFAKVMAGAGAFFWNRDSVDARLISEVISQQGQIIDSQDEIGGYPLLPVELRPGDWDRDADGLPDWWEEMFEGLDPQRADNNGDFNGNGYTNLEEYFHYQADPSASLPGDFDGDSDMDGADFLKWQRSESPHPLSSLDLADWEATFGTVASPVTTASIGVPEPSSFMLLLATFAGGMRERWMTYSNLGFVRVINVLRKTPRSAAQRDAGGLSSNETAATS